MLDVQKEHVWPMNNANLSIPPELLQSLRQHSLFQRTNNESFLEKIACCMHLRTYSPRDIIIVEGEPSKAMFFLLRGSVDVCSADFERIYATLPKGSCFGEIGILYSMARTATVIASTKCIVAALTAEDVKTLLPQYPEVERMLRFEAEERLALLKKSNSMHQQQEKKVNQKPVIERNIEEFSGARHILQRIPYFQSCPEEFLHLISLKVEPRHYAPNDVVIHRGDNANELFFIVEGTVEVANVEHEEAIDESIPVVRYGAGDYFGDISVLLNKPRAADARAVTALELYVLKKGDFVEVINRFPDLQNYFKAMAESSLTNLKKKASLVKKEENQPITVEVQAIHDPEILPSPPITASSVCSTTSDQDPTLLPPTAASALKVTETRRRRASVAIWSDPHLVALANRSMKPEKKDDGSNLKKQFTQDEYIPQFKFHADSSSRFMCMNEEILGRIIDNLDIFSILQLATVSKFLHEFIYHSDKILHTVDLSHDNKRITDKMLKGEIADLISTRVRTLNLSQCFYITDDGFSYLVERTPNLETLDLNSCWLLTDKSLSLASAMCPNLTSLDLSNCRKVSDAGIFRLCDEKQSRQFKGIQHLSLSYCKKLSDMTMSHLAEFCADTLESLNLQRCTRISDQGFARWAQTQFPKLTSLTLTDCSFLTDQAIANLVAAASNLEQLSLSFCCALSDSAIEGLATLKRLRDLDASFCGAAVSDVSIRSLFNNNEKKSKVALLNLRGCVRITDNGVKSIVELGSLMTLNISQCPCISTVTKQLIKDSGNILQLVV
ncbi:RNI-like protein [Backusella circina FSU 941]|nr:RNI-like protein [Backusella circina FSU 941]